MTAHNFIPKLTRACEFCGKATELLPSRIARGEGKFCSRECHNNKSKDIAGLVFGELTVIAATEQRRGKSILWRCRCSCGNECLITKTNLRDSTNPTCGVRTNHLLPTEHYRRSYVKNLIGQVFNELTVIDIVGTKPRTKWLCQCSCGKEVQVRTDSLIRGTTKACGHLVESFDLTGQRFGRLKVIEAVPNNKRGIKRWRCHCDCGKIINVNQIDLTTGTTISCKCYGYEMFGNRNRIHGMAGTATYMAFHTAKRRAAIGAFDCTDVTEDAMQEKLLAQNYQCHWCDTPFDDRPPHQDHIVPLSRGGSHMLDNLVWACGSCNSQKSNRLLHEWFAVPNCRARKFASAVLP